MYLIFKNVEVFTQIFLERPFLEISQAAGKDVAESWPWFERNEVIRVNSDQRELTKNCPVGELFLRWTNETLPKETRCWEVASPGSGDLRAKESISLESYFWDYYRLGVRHSRLGETSTCTDLHGGWKIPLSI